MVNYITYNSKEWHSIHPGIRCYIVPVAEGIKSGALLELWKPMYKKNKKSLIFRPLLRHSIEELALFSIGNYISKEKNILEKINQREITEGEFLGYPGCCVAKYEEHERRFIEYLNDKEDKIIISDLPLPPEILFRSQAIDAMKEGYYEHSLDYVMHTPCSAYCEKSISFARDIETSLKRCDPEAAEWIKNYNHACIEQIGNKLTAEEWFKYAENCKNHV